MAVIAVGNLKGGVGKSLLSVHLAHALATERRRVLVIDADAQGTSADWIERAGKVPVAIERLPLDAEADATGWIVRVVGLKDRAELVVIDLPPHVGAVMQAALVVADLFVMPATASGADLVASARALELVREARTERGGTLPRCLLVPSRVDRRTASGREIEAALGSFDEPVGPAIGQRSAFADCFMTGETVLTYAPASKAADEIRTLAQAVGALLKP